MEHALNGEAGLSELPWIWLISGLIIVAGLFYRFGFERTTEANGKIVRRFRLNDYLPASNQAQASPDRVVPQSKRQHKLGRKKQLRQLYELRQVTLGLLLYGLGVFLFGLGFVYAVTENTVSRFAWQALCLIGIVGVTAGIYIIVNRHRNNPFRKKMVALQRDSFLETKPQRNQRAIHQPSSADTYR